MPCVGAGVLEAPSGGQGDAEGCGRPRAPVVPPRWCGAGVVRRGDGVRRAEGSSSAVHEAGVPRVIDVIHEGASLEELPAAIAIAFRFEAIVVEQDRCGREIEYAVLGNDDPVASVCGETSRYAFYDYEAKYLTSTGRGWACPRVRPAVAARTMARRRRVTHGACAGMARRRTQVKSGWASRHVPIHVVSMYRNCGKRWACVPDLVTRLLDLAVGSSAPSTKRRRAGAARRFLRRHRWTTGQVSVRVMPRPAGCAAASLPVVDSRPQLGNHIVGPVVLRLGHPRRNVPAATAAPCPRSRIRRTRAPSGWHPRRRRAHMLRPGRNGRNAG